MDLIQFNAARLLHVTTFLTASITAHAVAKWGGHQPTMEFKGFAEEIDAILPDLDGLGLTYSAKSLVRLRTALDETISGKHSHNLQAQFGEFKDRLQDELANGFFWCLSQKDATLYQNPRSGWEEVISRFPDTKTDIDEASKCFALSRYAAATFHCLQVVEIGLIELGTIIVAQDHQAGWNATIAHLAIIKATKHQDRTTFQRQNAQFLEQIGATTEVLKGAWRNKISHAQGKLTLLTSDFTPEVAHEILVAACGFMRRLATEMPTSPDPDA